MYKNQVVASEMAFEDMISKIGLDLSKKHLLVCDSSINFLGIKDYFLTKENAVIFNEFTPNPLYEDVCKGVDLFRKNNCEFIIAVGGGSAIDVAKCIKLFATMNDNELYLKQEFKENDIKLLAIPTTAGTGSESTRFAVIYYNHEKQSIAHNDIIPDCVILEPSVLNTLPVFQKKCTLLDAMCQAIESYWSVNSTDESKEYSKKAIHLIMTNYKAYLSGDNSFNSEILLASNYSGKAINITQTTAAHAMSYKITSLFGLPHGYAAALCLPFVWEYMTSHIENVIDKRGGDYLKEVFLDISALLGCKSSEESISWFKSLLAELELFAPKEYTDEDIEVLAASVNPVRLGNNPVSLSKDELKEIYINIFTK